MSKSTKRFVVFKIYLYILFSHACVFPTCCFRRRTNMAEGLDNGVLSET